MSREVSLAPLQALVENPLPDRVAGGFIVLLGDHPSSYSRSPQIWAPVLARFGIEAAYLPLDVPEDRLARVVAVLRETDACLGANVTVPHKAAVLPLLDEVAHSAAAIGAVNTIVRTRDGRLAGANTDGVGLVAALLRPDEGGPMAETLYGLSVLLLGAGGAARAAAVTVSPLLGPGELLVANRTPERAREVARIAAASGARATAVPQGTLEECLPSVGLVINASLRGQAGVVKSPAGWFCLEPYSALATASPAVLPPMPEGAFEAEWTARSAADIAANHALSQARVGLLPRDAAVLDMVYAPAETTTLRHARAAGLRAANGRWMIIAQAAEAFARHICALALAARGIGLEAARDEATALMDQAWEG